MNVFYLDTNLGQAAAWHVDKHVVKMPIEALQICSTALYTIDRPLYERLALYKPTHTKHPIVRWVIENPTVIGFVATYGACVATEYTYRYKKVHACHHNLSNIIRAYYTRDTLAYQLPQCMPDEFKQEYNPTEAYKDYYANAKTHLHSWTKRDPPEWIARYRRTT
jgi:hypothetical protein